MAAGSAAPERGGFDHLREHSIGLPQVLFQSITHMAPAAAVAYSIYISVPDAKQALPLSVGLALIACLCAATAIGQLAKHIPSAGGLYTYVAKLARRVGRPAHRLALRRLPAARRAVPLSRVRLGDARRVRHGGRLALERPVGRVGAADGGDRLPADLSRRPPLDDGGRDPRSVRDRDLRRARAVDALLQRGRPEPRSRSTRHTRRANGAACSRGWSSRFSRSSASRPLHRSARKRRIHAARCPGRSSARRSRSASSTCSARTPGCSAPASTTS